MTIEVTDALFMLVGLALYFAPFQGQAAKLNQLGLMVFTVAFAHWLF